ncbi:hypothetical protein [Streptomyces sp. enrichment culture]|uniref:hypothetical protein n=1 Tax=Streptomyces sp. enrichment culture TaxID=1795815 RepID=UPI003F5749E3
MTELAQRYGVSESTVRGHLTRLSESSSVRGALALDGPEEQTLQDLAVGHLAFATETDVRSAQETGGLCAEQGVPLADTLRAYRVGFEYLWAQVIDEAQRHPEVTDAQLVAGSPEIWALSGRYAEAVDAYRETSAELALRREARRSALVEALFTGALVGRTTPLEAARQLGLPERGPYVMVAAAVPVPNQEPLPGIERTLREAHVPSAWRLLPDMQIGVVSLAHPGAETTSLRALRAAAAHGSGSAHCSASCATHHRPCASPSSPSTVCQITARGYAASTTVLSRSSTRTPFATDCAASRK